MAPALCDTKQDVVDQKPTVAMKTSSHTNSNIWKLKFPIEYRQPLVDEFVVFDRSFESGRCAWLRSQIIGAYTHINTPFGRRLITYADDIATGRSLLLIEKFILEKVLPIYGNTHTHDSHVGHITTTMVHEAASYIKRCMGGTTNDALMLCGSGSTAALKRLQEVMGISVPSILRDKVLSVLDQKERWVIFVGPYEHHSNLLSWQQSLAEVIEIPSNDEGLINMEKLKEYLEDHQYSKRPKLGSFSACSNVTGILTDTREIAKLMHEHGGFVCFDFASCGPYSRIDMRSVEADGYDAVVLSPHKFVGGPGSPGILLMNKRLYLLQDGPPTTPGGGTVDYVNNFNSKDTLFTADIETRENAGTPPIIQIIRAALAYCIKEQMGYDLIQNRERFFAQAALKRLSTNPKVIIMGNKEIGRLPIISFLVSTEDNPLTPLSAISSEQSPKAIHGNQQCKQGKPLQGRFVTKLLSDLFGIQARGGCSCASPYAHYLLNIDKFQSLKLRDAITKGYVSLKPGWARVSFSYYISIDEFDFILSAIEFIADYGQRFLPLYELDWKTGNWMIPHLSTKNSMFPKAFSKFPACLGAMTAVSAFRRSVPSCMQKTKTDSRPEKDCKACHQIYLNDATMIAQRLSPHPKERSIPSDIDPSMVYFKI
ncbi:hypothetical protein O6H91_10G090400 [Diphasiastrum complanatum]|uniref:Uncharacterized protein n=1 Tax=Diphasiastrum complanatum TaxID=34168 RepID=A0ACC2CJ97_DIPCM|nr:hypothetical protein O6H91_10G090400 [Diphasiastrum complanatum]